jgi:hypothetical protein
MNALVCYVGIIPAFVNFSQSVATLNDCKTKLEVIIEHYSI